MAKNKLKKEDCRFWRTNLTNFKQELRRLSLALEELKENGQIPVDFLENRYSLRVLPTALEDWYRRLQNTRSGEIIISDGVYTVHISLLNKREINGNLIKVGDYLKCTSKSWMIKTGDHVYKPHKIKIKIVGFELHTGQIIIELKGKIEKIFTRLSDYQLGNNFVKI